MIYIALIAVIGILLLQGTGAIPLSSVGGPMVIALASFTAALAVAIHEAWTKKRGMLGWLVNSVVSFVGTFVAAPLGGMIVVIILSPVYRWAVAGRHGRSRGVCRARRHDAGRAAGIVGCAVDSPVILSRAHCAAG